MTRKRRTRAIRIVAAWCMFAVAVFAASPEKGSATMETGASPQGSPVNESPNAIRGFTDAADFGFSVDATGIANTQALQRAVDCGGTIVVSRPGVYKIAATVYLGSDTSLVFGNGVFLKKVKESKVFTHVLLNKGAVTRTWDHNITVTGLHIVCNGVDARNGPVVGLHGQLAFSYVKDLRVDRFRCLDLGKAQFAVHVCTFENIIIDDVVIKGDKDGVHLGRGKGFTIRNGVFQTFDDAVALNGHDYSACNPQLGWIENGVVENCRDLDAEKTTGYFCRILAGGWIDWQSGMKVQQSDTVVSNGRVYRVCAKADGTIYTSNTRPTHESGYETLDGIKWVMAQDDVAYTAGVRNVVFRDIFLEKSRTAFAVVFSNSRYSRSYYPEARVPLQQHLTFENVQVLHEGTRDFLSLVTPVDRISIVNCMLGQNRIRIASNSPIGDYGTTSINMVGCVFKYHAPMDLLVNSVKGKKVFFQTTGSVQIHDTFRANLEPGDGDIAIRSDLTGLSR